LAAGGVVAELLEEDDPGDEGYEEGQGAEADESDRALEAGHQGVGLGPALELSLAGFDHGLDPEQDQEAAASKSRNHEG
jgi:hypothetical protein